MNDAVIIIGSAVAIVLLLWSIVGVRYLRGLRDGVEKQWDQVLKKLSKRQDKVPLLVELVKKYGESQAVLIQQLIVGRRLAAKSVDASGVKMEYEYDLTKQINKAMDLGRIYPELGRDVNFLGIRKEIRLLEEEIEAEVKEYRESVRDLNRRRKKFYLIPLAVTAGVSEMNIFDVEQ